MRSFRLAVPLIVLYFLLLTNAAVNAAFSPDDTMNLYRSWSQPSGELVKANLLFWEASPFYRPLPAAWYLAIFHFAGYRPWPFHAVELAILAANILLTYGVARRLSGSWETGALAALLGCYHPSFTHLYFDTGFIYDVLCYFFYFAALLLYLRVRQAGKFLNVPECAALVGLYICALNSKEMAITLPVVLLTYEWLYEVKGGRWTFTRAQGVLCTGVITLAFVIGRARGADSLLANPQYRPSFTWQRFMETSSGFIGDLFLLRDHVTSALVLILWAATLAIAWKSRSRALWFAWLFAMLTSAPIAFLAPRGAPQYYIPLFGWAFYVAIALAAVFRRRASLAFAALLLLLLPLFGWKGWANVYSVQVEGEALKHVLAQLHGLYPRLPAGTRLLFLNAPSDVRQINLIFVVRLSYADDSLQVDGVDNTRPRPADNELATYNHVFLYRGGRVIELFRPWQWKPVPMVSLTPQGAEIFHTDWAPVTEKAPARAGETLISRSIGLGETSPPVPPQQPFPSEPRAVVKAPFEIRLNGRSAKLVEAFGWPGETDTFRMDFRVPPDMPAGNVKLEIASAGATGPPAYFPVR